MALNLLQPGLPLITSLNTATCSVIWVSLSLQRPTCLETTSLLLTVLQFLNQDSTRGIQHYLSTELGRQLLPRLFYFHTCQVHQTLQIFSASTGPTTRSGLCSNLYCFSQVIHQYLQRVELKSHDCSSRWGVATRIASLPYWLGCLLSQSFGQVIVLCICFIFSTCFRYCFAVEIPELV